MLYYLSNVLSSLIADGISFKNESAEALEGDLAAVACLGKDGGF